MSTPIPITPEMPPQFPCWLWELRGDLPEGGLWVRFLAAPDFEAGRTFTHYFPDQPEPPKVRPGEEDDNRAFRKQLAAILSDESPAGETPRTDEAAFYLSEAHRYLPNESEVKLVVADFARQLERELAETDELNARLADLLRNTAAALKGAPKPLHLHDWSDLPEVAANLRGRLAEVERELAGAHRDCERLSGMEHAAQVELAEVGSRMERALAAARKDTPS